MVPELIYNMLAGSGLRLIAVRIGVRRSVSIQNSESFFVLDFE